MLGHVGGDEGELPAHVFAAHCAKKAEALHIPPDRSVLYRPVRNPGATSEVEDLVVAAHDRVEDALRFLHAFELGLLAIGTACTVGRSVPLPQCAYDRRCNQYLANAFLGLAAQAAPALADPRGKVLAVIST